MLSTISQRKHEEKALQFLRGLNEQYGNIQSHVLLLDHIPPVTKSFSYVMQQERQLMYNNFLNNLEPKTVNATMSTAVCSFCGKNGDIDAVCFNNHGFPTKSLSNKKACSHCGKAGIRLMCAIGNMNIHLVTNFTMVKVCFQEVKNRPMRQL